MKKRKTHCVPAPGACDERRDVYGLATTAFAATEEMTLYMYDLPRGGANRTAWGHPALSLMGGWNSAGRDGYWSVFCKDSYSGQIVYCIEPGVHCATGDLNSLRRELLGQLPVEPESDHFSHRY